MSVVVAAFDVDETLTVRDCVIPFMLRVGGFGLLVRTSVRAIPKLARRDRNEIKAHFVSAIFTNQQMSVVDSHGISFASAIANNWMRQDVCARLRWHQDQGHVVVLVSASLSPYLLPLGDLLEVDAVLCTELEIDETVYTGQIVGTNCRGAEKAERLRKWCEDAGIDVSSVVYAYGDSSGDTELLDMATNGIWVNKSTLDEVPS